MDTLKHNRAAWDKLVEQQDRWTRPVSREDVERARRGNLSVVLTPTIPVPDAWFPNLDGLPTLCLASAGGQQAPLLAASGAKVTVLDNSTNQLEQDRLVAEREGLSIELLHGDMADLSDFADESLGLIFHPCSNVFVPNVNPVWRECHRVLRPGGVLLAGFTNPVRYLFDDERKENGNLQVRYSLPYSDLDHIDEPHIQQLIQENQPLEFGHTLSPMPTSICPTVDELAAMLGGTLNEDRLDAVMEHVDQCDECQAKVENIQTIDPLEQQLADLNGRKLPSSDGSSRSGSGSSSAKVIELPTEIGPYRLYRTIAVGGMGTVYEARHRRLGRPFAVKLLHFGSRMSRMEAEMVRSEWRTHGRLVHPNIVSATDAGIADGQPYLVTERIEGIDLSTLVKRHGPLKPADACEIIRQAAEGLEYAHEQQVVHGDVKPSNLMLNQRGVVKLLDLGTARPLDHTTLGRRKSGTTHGTLAYMAPEQLWRELNSEDQLKRDHRADIYSLGCSLYCLLTGQPPFSGAGEKSNQELIEAHRSASPTPLSEAVPNRDSIDPELQQVVDRMLEKNANDRFDSMRQLADQLSPLCQANHVHALAQQYSESADTDDHASEFIDASRGLTTLLTIGSPKRPWLLPAVASTILLVAVSAWFLMRQTDQPPSNVSLASSTPPMQQPAQRIPEQQIFTARTSLGEDITNAEGPFWVPSPRTGTSGRSRLATYQV